MRWLPLFFIAGLLGPTTLQAQVLDSRGYYEVRCDAVAIALTYATEDQPLNVLDVQLPGQDMLVARYSADRLSSVRLEYNSGQSLWLPIFSHRALVLLVEKLLAERNLKPLGAGQLIADGCPEPV